MYWRPETAPAWRAFWNALHRSPGAPALPARLGTPRDPMRHWQAPHLALSQTCGLPYAQALHGQVQLIGTPDFGLPGCPPGYYRSVFVMRAGAARPDPGDWAGLTLAVNSADSQSGWGAPSAFAAAHGFAFAHARLTGAHRASAHAVATGRAGIACLDMQSWRMIRRWDRFAQALTPLAMTAPTPGLPLIAGPAMDAPALSRAARLALARMPRLLRERLGLTGTLAPIPAAAYRALPDPPPLPPPPAT